MSICFYEAEYRWNLFMYNNDGSWSVFCIKILNLSEQPEKGIFRSKHEHNNNKMLIEKQEELKSWLTSHLEPL